MSALDETRKKEMEKRKPSEVESGRLSAEGLEPDPNCRFDPYEYLLEVRDYISSLRREYRLHREKATAEINESKAESGRLLERSIRAEQEVERLKEIIVELEVKVAKLEEKIDKEQIVSDRLREDLEKVENELDDTKIELANYEKKSFDLEERCSRIDFDLEQVQNLKSVLEAKLETCEAALIEERGKTVQMDRRLRKASKELSSAKDKAEMLEKKSDETLAVLASEKRRMAERIHSEAEHEVKSYQNRIESSLVADFRNFEKLKYQEMTVEVGEKMRYQVNELFTKLKELGIDFLKVDG